MGFHLASSSMRAAALMILFCELVFGTGSVWAEDQVIRIGVLSHRGDAATQQIWTPTAEYLTEELPGYRFEIVPLDFARVDPAVGAGAVEFVLVNPGIYVNLEVRHRVSRIATMRNRAGGASLNVFGGVIFTRADRTDIESLSDLAGRSFLAVDPTSLGGFEMAWGVLRGHGIDPFRDFASLRFMGTHDRVVLHVKEGLADAGTVRTDILERMARDGTIRLEELRILNPLRDSDFPFVRSTPLFPEWPFSKLRGTSNELAQKVSIALLSMPENHRAAITGQYAGWTVPLDYQPVHDLLRELRLPPYDQPVGFTLADAARRFWPALLLGAVALLVMGVLTVWVLRLNRSLAAAKQRIEEQHALILSSVAEGVYGVDLDGRATFVNKAMERITGWLSSELIGRNQHELLHHTRPDGTLHPADECPVYATFRDSVPRYIEDDVFWKKNGESFPVEYSTNPIKDERGETVGSVVVFRDMTERKRIQEKEQQHQLELAHVARLSSLGEMASGIAHELNQPLTAIATNARACVRMLESGGTSSERCSDVMEKVAAQAERAGAVIRQIRRFVRKEEPECGPVRVSAIFASVQGLMRPDARRAGVTLLLDQRPGCEWVVAQPIQIEQVMINLVRNAIEAMTETGVESRRVTLRAAPAGAGFVELAVADNGPGVSEEVVDRIFDPFVTTKPQGMGLGLSISSGIVQAHQSRLTISSHPGEGTTFSFLLPAYRGGTDHGN